MLNVIQMGLGPIGCQLSRYLSQREGINIVGAVDPDPQKAGKNLARLAGLEKPLDVAVASQLDKDSGALEADIAIISTVSSIDKIEPQIKEAADHQLDIVTTCEELSYPWQTHPESAARINDYCRKRSISCIGTGVNPGFLMDYLPSVLTSVCEDVRHVRVERIQDAAPRRKPFRDKIGAGLSEDEFNQKRDSIRHVGLPQSTYMIAEAMGWELDRVTESMDPVLAEESINIENQRELIPKGAVAGVEQVARGFQDGKEVITLLFKAAVGLDDPQERIHITGTPDFSSVIEGGINGDVATSAIIVNAVRAVRAARPGLRTMLDIPAPAYFSRL